MLFPVQRPVLLAKAAALDYDGREDFTVWKRVVLVRKHPNDSLLIQGGILAAAGMITKLLGFFYRIPMANLLGEQGNGIYSVAFGIYNIVLTLSSYSLPTAVSKLIAERLGRGEREGGRRIFRTAMLFALFSGLCAAAALFFGAAGLERLYHRAGLARPLRVLAPTAFIVAVLGVLRGWFQGRGNMVPTAISQIIEQVANMAVSLFATWQFLRIYQARPDAPSFGAAGGTLGTLAGAAAALLFLLLLYRLNVEEHTPSCGQTERRSMLLRALVLTVVPMMFSQTIYQMGSTVDDLLFGTVMEHQGMPDHMASSLLGVYNSQYNQMTTLPVAITAALAATLLPEISMLNAQGRRGAAMRKTQTVVKLNMALAIPAAVGLAVLAEPIMALLFPNLTAYRTLSARMLQVGSFAVVFYALSTITAAVLQGSNDMNTPAYHAAAALAVHVGLVYFLLRRTTMGIYALVAGNVTFPLLLSLLNCYAIRQKLNYRWELRRTMVLPALASALMAFFSRALYAGLRAVGVELSWSLLITVLAAIVFYGVVLLRIGCFTRREIAELPMGKMLARIAGIPDQGRKT